MSQKVLMTVLALTAATVMLATPVTAISPKKIAVTFYADVSLGQFPDWWLGGDVIHGRDGTLDFDNCILMGDGINLICGSGTKTYDYDLNVKGVEPTPGPPLAIYGEGVLHYTLVIDFGDGNTFEGNHELRGEFKVFDSGYVHPWNSFGQAVYRGTGDYLGWTWVMSDVTINGVPQFEAYMLIP
jgi:hypothetical protein